VRIVREVHASDINTVDWSYQNENLIATGSNDATVKILDIRKLPSEQTSDATAAQSAVTCTLRGHKAKVQSVKFSPFSSRYLASSGDSLILWDIEAGNLKPENDHEEIKQGQSPEDHVILDHIGHIGTVSDFDWNHLSPWTLVSASDDSESFV
jgi:histone-binding protein RBBP4